MVAISNFRFAPGIVCWGIVGAGPSARPCKLGVETTPLRQGVVGAGPSARPCKLGVETTPLRQGVVGAGPFARLRRSGDLLHKALHFQTIAVGVGGKEMVNVEAGILTRRLG